MADQRRNAGNIGDVVKHALLPSLVASYSGSVREEWAYCETHAGYYDYPLSLLKKGNAWKGERAWTMGVLEQSGQLHTLGVYGKELAKSLKEGVYPGSIRIIASLEDHARPTLIHGWDIGEQQVKSFAGRNELIKVSLHDGYSAVQSLQHEKRLVFCDPFWSDPHETSKVQAILEKETAVVVWYPLSSSSESFRKWLSRQSYPLIEIKFRHYVANRNGWAGQDSQGAGMMCKGLPPAACDAALELGKRLQSLFENRTHTGKTRKVKGVVIAPQTRNISLDIECSFPK